MPSRAACCSWRHGRKRRDRSGFCSARGGAELDRYNVEHETRYAYRVPVSQSWQLAHLTPCRLPWQRVVCARARDRAARPTSATRRATPSATASPTSACTGRIRCCACACSARSRSSRPARRERAPALAWEAVRESLLDEPAQDDLRRRRAWPSRARSCRGRTPRSPTRRRASRAGRDWLDAVTDLMQRIHREFEFDAERDDRDDIGRRGARAADAASARTSPTS